LFDHLEKTFSVDRANIDLCLEASHFVGPRHRFASEAVWSELHKTLIDGVEEALVLDVDGLPDHLRLLRHVWSLPREQGFLSGFFDLEVEVNWDDRVLLQVLSRLKVLIGADF